MLFPALREAAKDRALEGPPLRIYLHLVEVLDFEDKRPVKQAPLAMEFKLSEPTVRKAMRRLVDRGYLRIGSVTPGEARTYSLVYRRKAS